MKKFKVIALNVTGLNGNVHYAKDELKADQLGGLERANDLVEQGFLKPIEETKKAATSKKSK